MAYGITLDGMKGMVPEYIAPLLDILTDSAYLLKILPFETIETGFDPVIPTEEGSSITFRNFNAGYDDKTHNPATVTEKIRPFGEVLKYDSAMSAQGIARHFANKQRYHAGYMGLKFCDAFINGDSSESGELSYGFDGIKARCEFEDTNTDARVIDVGTTAGAGIMTMAIVDELVESVAGGANVVLCNRFGHGLIKQLAQSQTHKFRFDWQNIPGATEKFISLDGRALFVPMWENSQGQEIIPTENGTDFYALKIGQSQIHGLQGKAMPDAGPGLYIGPIERIPASPVLGQMFEWVAGIAVPSRRYMMMLTGVQSVETAS